MAAGNEGKPSIVLVHGVWSDGSSWSQVIPLLGHAGYKVSAAQLPLTSFAEDVAATKRWIDHQDGPVLLVGHSYGGAVISEAGNSHKVKKLVYIAAFAPQPDQKFGSIISANPPEDMKPDENGFVWATADQFHGAIAHDLHRGVANLAVAVQKPFAMKVFDASIAKPAWKSKPSWYLVTTEDRILNPETQREMARQIGAQARETPSSHLALLSKPQAVADIILEAADAGS